MILDGGPLISRACRGGTGPNVALGLVPRIGPQPIAKGLTTKTEPNLSKISLTVVVCASIADEPRAPDPPKLESRASPPAH